VHEIDTEKNIQKVIFSLALLAVTYNAFLALINSIFTQVSNGLVVFTEVTILGGCLICFFYQNKLLEKDKYVFFLFLSIIFSFILTLISTQIVFLDGIRNFLIICVFFLIGCRFSVDALRKLFLISSIIVASILIIEITMLDVYVKLFEPARYYQNTRNIDTFEFDTIGVFGNALGFDGRFTYGIFDGPRTSSIFLEQVGLANFCSVLGIYLLVFMPILEKKIKMFYICLIVLICVSNETRIGGTLAASFFIISYFRAKIPYFSNITVPILTIFSGFFIASFYSEAVGDGLLGRVNLGFGHFMDIEFLGYFGRGILKLNQLWDSGYGYLFSSSTIVGAIAFISFILFIIKQTTRAGVLCALGLSMYIFINLMVGGNAIYSIKTATLLWVLVGFIYNSEIKKIGT